ncbi:MAG TPA: hypothetical protein DEQ32_15505 [Gammaproteobacteria bacterium]|nr:hypothetical protein [Gammaproteobacteria bacterium]
MSGWNNLDFTRFNQGDLVRWTDSIGGRSEKEYIGVVTDVFPSNVYESESCVVLCESRSRHVDSKHLRLVSDIENI